MAVNKVNKISKDTKIKVKLKSPLLLPNNPSERGLTPSQIKNTFASFVIDDSDSTFSEIDRVVEEINEINEEFDNRITEKEHEHQNKLLIDTYDQSNEELSDAVKKRHEHINKEVLDSYKLKQEELIRLVGTGSSSGGEGSNPQDLYILREELKQEIQETYDKTKEADNNILGKVEENKISLQTQIDSINASQNLIDIVGSYEALELYDTTNVKDNDKIGVLTDETNYETFAYYRWDAVNNVWLLIGSVNTGVTLAQAESLFAPKEIVNIIPNKLIEDNNQIVLAKDNTPISSVRIKKINGKSILGEGELLPFNFIEITTLKALSVTEQLAFSQLVEDFKDEESLNYKKACNTNLLHKQLVNNDIKIDYYLLSSILTLADETICITFVSTNLDNRAMVEVYSSDEGATWSIVAYQKYVSANVVKFESEETLEEVINKKANTEDVYSIKEADELFDEKQDKCIDENGNLTINGDSVINNDGDTVYFGNSEKELHFSASSRPTINIVVGDKVVYTKVATYYDLEQLIGSADETMNTLGELSQAIRDNEDVLNVLNSAIANKASKDEVFYKDETYDRQAIEELIYEAETNNRIIVDDSLNINSTNPVQNSVISKQLGCKSVLYPMYLEIPTEENKKFLYSHPGTYVYDFDTELIFAPVASYDFVELPNEYVSISVQDKIIHHYYIDWGSFEGTYTIENLAMPDYGAIMVNGGHVTDFYMGNSKCIKFVLFDIEGDDTGDLNIYICEQGNENNTELSFTIPQNQYSLGITLERINDFFYVRDTTGKFIGQIVGIGLHHDTIRFTIDADTSSSYISFSYRLEG